VSFQIFYFVRGQRVDCKQMEENHDTNTNTLNFKMVARSHISAGTLILKEEALIDIPLREESANFVYELSGVRTILSKALVSSPSEILSFLRVLLSIYPRTEDSASFTEDAEHAMKHEEIGNRILKNVHLCKSIIINTETGTSKAEARFVVFEKASFLNHSCVPNSRFSCVSESGKAYAMVTALRDVAKDDEITISYDKVLFDCKEGRKMVLKKRFPGGTCWCEACKEGSSALPTSVLFLFGKEKTSQIHQCSWCGLELGCTLVGDRYYTVFLLVSCLNCEITKYCTKECQMRH